MNSLSNKLFYYLNIQSCFSIQKQFEYGDGWAKVTAKSKFITNYSYGAIFASKVFVQGA